MSKRYHIANSFPGKTRTGYTLKRVKEEVARGGEAREGYLLFYYPTTFPSEPQDVMPTTSKQILLGQLDGEDEGQYVVQATGVVDDQAIVDFAGQVYESPSGAQVPIEHTFRPVRAGVYTVTVQHFNTDKYPKEGNLSCLTCYVGPGGEVEITPSGNDREPEDADCTAQLDGEEDEAGCGCGEAEGTEAGGGGGGARLGEDWGYTSTSGGSDVRRVASGRKMSWSARFGSFRGLAGVPAGRMKIGAYQEFEAELGRPAGLVWEHPLGTWLSLPEGGKIQPNRIVAVHSGIEVTNYMLDGMGEVFFPVGASSRTRMKLAPVREMSKAEWAECGITEAKLVRAAHADGSAAFYSKESGVCVGYISAEGLLLDEALVANLIAVVRDDAGVIRQIWNAWDGLADVVEEEEAAGYEIRIYPPSQVGTPGDDGLYRVEGEAVRVFRISAEGQRLTITERDKTLPEKYGEYVTAWELRDGAWSLTLGQGAEAVVARRERKPIGGDMYAVITRKMKGGVAASVTYEQVRQSNVGTLLLSRTEGYDSPVAQTTHYSYGENGRLVATYEPNGAVQRTVYDASGRVTLQSSTWSDGWTRIEETTYLDSEEEYSERPAIKRVVYASGSKTNEHSRTYYAYSQEESGIERVEERTVAAGSNVTQVTVEETWLAEVQGYESGRVRMRQAADGVQTWYEYKGAYGEYGALYCVKEETRVEGEAVPGLSTRTMTYISAEGNTLREERHALLSDGTWVKLSGVRYSYDVFNRQIGAVYDNGRQTSRTYTCQSKPLQEVDENGVVTTYAYNSARQLVEKSRSEVYTAAGECITPETITEYVRDAADRVTRTSTFVGPMKTVTRTQYDLLGRVTQQVDELGRITSSTYEQYGRVVTTTLPNGATLINTYNADGSLAVAAGTGQQELRYVYDYDGGLRSSTYLADGKTLLSRSIVDGFGQTIEQLAPTTQEGVYLRTHSNYNGKGQLVLQRVGHEAPVLYEYDSLGNLVRQSMLLDSEQPADAEKNRITTLSQRYEQGEDAAVYLVTTSRRNNPAGEWLESVQRRLVSELSPTLESWQESIDERGHATTEWTEYGREGSQRIWRQRIPTSIIEAERISYDGFVTREVDSSGLITLSSRRYLEGGLMITQLQEGRGVTTTTWTDIALRTIKTTQGEADTTTIVYDPASNNPAVITNALGLTTCYAYDVRGRKVAEYGTGVQPAVYAYDDADRLIALTTWRMGQTTITTDPRGLTGGDTTRWAYDAATGLELSITYADGLGSTRAYDESNRLRVVTDARGISTLYTWDESAGLCTGISYSAPGSAPQSYAYDILGQLTAVTDAAGERRFIYDSYGTLVEERYRATAAAGGEEIALREQLDIYGRSTGYTLSLIRRSEDEEEEEELLQRVVTGYAEDGRIGSAGFAHGGAEQRFSYVYMPGSSLLQTLTMPNGVTLTQSWAADRDLLTGMAYTGRGQQAPLASRSYSYDTLGRPETRDTTRRGAVVEQSTFGYNARNELTSAIMSGEFYGYDYDNIGNRRMMFGGAEYATYGANELNQYTLIDTNGTPFEPEYDADGNQTLLQTRTGIWRVTYNAQNRAIRFENTESNTIITCDYDYMGRRFVKKVSVNGATTLHERYLYRGYLQIAALDLLANTTKHAILWDPTQPIATRPLALQKDGTWYTYGWDLTKNICEVFTAEGALATTYTYTPFGEVTAEGAVSQPLQWSSEIHDPELALIYYNYRYYNPQDGRWTRRDPAGIEGGMNLYKYVENSPTNLSDYIGKLVSIKTSRSTCSIKVRLSLRLSFDASVPENSQNNLVTVIKQTIENEWNGWKKGCCKILVNADVDIAGFWTSVLDMFTSRLNSITVSHNLQAGYNNDARSYVRNKREGVFVINVQELQNPNPRIQSTIWAVAHEAGHLMGLNDAYDVATNEVLSGHDPTEMMARVFGHVHDSEIGQIVAGYNCPCGDQQDISK